MISKIKRSLFADNFQIGKNISNDFTSKHHFQCDVQKGLTSTFMTTGHLTCYEVIYVWWNHCLRYNRLFCFYLISVAFLYDYTVFEVICISLPVWRIPMKYCYWQWASISFCRILARSKRFIVYGEAKPNFRNRNGRNLSRFISCASLQLHPGMRG